MIHLPLVDEGIEIPTEELPKCVMRELALNLALEKNTTLRATRQIRQVGFCLRTRHQTRVIRVPTTGMLDKIVAATLVLRPGLIVPEVCDLSGCNTFVEDFDELTKCI